MEKKVKHNPYAKYLIDEEIQKQGIIYEDEDVRIRVTFAGTENSRYEKLLKMKLKPFETQIRQEKFSDERFNKLLAEVYAETVILSWESLNEDGKFVSGVYNEEGGIMPVTKESMCKAFEIGNRLFQDVIKVATNFNLFRQGQKEEDTKN